MTDKNLEPRARDSLDDIDATVTRITDDHIEARLREILSRARRIPLQQENGESLAEEDLTRLL